MDSMKVLDRIARGDFHRPGELRCERLFDLEPEFFARLSADVQRLATGHLPSDVQSPDHVTNWTRPIGRPVQFSLLNATGDFSDTSLDHDLKVSGKSFHHAATYPAIASLVDALPGLLNMRINGMPPSGGLSPHEEHVTRRVGRSYFVRGRFHLPIATNPEASVMLDGHWYHLEPGSIYFFNNGCVHSAMNRGDTQRYHLVWDMALSREVVEVMFGDTSRGILHRTPDADRDVPVVRTETIDEYAISGAGSRLYDLLRMSKLGIRPHRWQNVFQKVAWRAYSSVGSLRYSDYE